MFADTFSAAQALYFTTYPEQPGSVDYWKQFMAQKLKITELSLKTFRADLQNLFRDNKRRSMGIAALAAVNAVWLNGEDAVWFSGTDALLHAHGATLTGTGVGLAASASTVMAANTLLSFTNARHLRSDVEKVSSPTVDRQPIVRRIARHIGMFGTTMAIGAPLNTIEGQFTKAEVVAHNLGYAALGTGIIAAAYEGIDATSWLSSYDNPAIVSTVAGSVIAGRYIKNVFKRYANDAGANGSS